MDLTNSQIELKGVLSLGDEVAGEDMVAVDGDGDANVVQLKNLLLKKMKLLRMGKTTSLTVQNEVPSHGDVVDGEDEVVDGDGDVSVVLPIKLLLPNPKMSTPLTIMKPTCSREALSHGDVEDGEDAEVAGDGANSL